MIVGFWMLIEKYIRKGVKNYGTVTNQKSL